MQELKNVNHPAGQSTRWLVKGSLPGVFSGSGVYRSGIVLCGSYLLADAILQPMIRFPGRRRNVFGAGDGLLSYLAWPSKRGSSVPGEPAVRPSALTGKKNVRGAAPTRRQA